MDKRKILFINPSLCHGGREQFQLSMLQNLDEERYDITLYLYKDDMSLLPLVPEHVNVIVAEKNIHYYRNVKAIFLYCLKLANSLIGRKEASVLYANKLQKYIHEKKMKYPLKKSFGKENFDVVIANAEGTTAEMALYILADKRYVFMHNSIDMHHELSEKLFPEYDGIVAVSLGVKDMLERAYPMVREKIFLLENYVDANEIITKASFETCLGFSNNKIKIASCGRISSEKGFDLAAKSAVILKKRNYDFHWVFIGDGTEREKVENIIRENNMEKQVTITGYTDNPFSLIKECDIYVQPSYEEAYGRTIKEAMILGCPVVSTSTTGGKSLIENGKNGILTDIDEVALAEGIISLIENTDMLKKYRNCYSKEQNLKEKQIFIEKMEALLQ